MSTKPDLRVIPSHWDRTMVQGRPATIADLVAALIAEGGEITETRPFGGKGLIEVDERGRYLAYGPIPAEETTP